MPPAHIFIARHGERMDHINPDFGKTYARPHDSPLTPNGVAMAEALGAHLVQHYHIAPADTVVLSSPLTRCVQTSHGIVNGALRAVGDGAQSIPIYLEPAFIEGAHWIFHHLSKNPLIVDPSTGDFHCPDPVYYEAAFHRDYTSRFVQLSMPFTLHSPPQFVCESNKLVESTFPERCDEAARQLLSVPELDGKTVVLVAHAETAPRAMHALMHTPFLDWHEGLTFSAFVHLTCVGDSAETRVLADSEIFSTPHL